MFLRRSIAMLLVFLEIYVTIFVTIENEGATAIFLKKNLSRNCRECIFDPIPLGIRAKIHTVGSTRCAKRFFRVKTRFRPAVSEWSACKLREWSRSVAFCRRTGPFWRGRVEFGLKTRVLRWRTQWCVAFSILRALSVLRGQKPPMLWVDNGFFAFFGRFPNGDRVESHTKMCARKFSTRWENKRNCCRWKNWNI